MGGVEQSPSPPSDPGPSLVVTDEADRIVQLADAVQDRLRGLVRLDTRALAAALDHPEEHPVQIVVRCASVNRA